MKMANPRERFAVEICEASPAKELRYHFAVMQDGARDEVREIGHEERIFDQARPPGAASECVGAR